NEFILPKTNITGEWKVNLLIEETSYNKYKGLGIEYKFHILQKGYEIIGTGEKIKDIYPDNKEYSFQRIKRVRINTTGFMDRKYLDKTKLYFNILEDGRIRPTSATFTLILIDENNMSGTFVSTSADSKGTVKFTRG
ncbi:MAG: hypothetical protein ACHP6H_06985, partial [Legionellales bacterium]